MSTSASSSAKVSGGSPEVKVVVASTYAKARRAMSARGIDPGSVVVVIDVEGARRLGTSSFSADEVLWESVPHSFSKVVVRLVRDHIE